ncbi:hypothetical protein [Vitreoscilla stercoraria]|uniref:VapD n=1 Tax=Vitreoscilla stercoraria TaxID=61 RepID=A0ABY4EEA8_VITST|nr:hypothetical protein [Vitreoscilla stercoraria]UOO93767.1 VapD [Vitreoscilla stercoraria]
MSKYIISFDLNNEILSQEYHVSSYNNAYANIKTILEKHGFKNLQGSVYIGNENVSEAHGTIAIQEITARYNWFSKAVSDIKFYRIESDLNAQFIVDGVEHAKRAFFNQIQLIKHNLAASGLTEEQIENIIGQQVFQLPNLVDIPLNKIK